MFTNSTKYAIRTVLYLAEHQKEDIKYRAIDIANDLDIPKQFLSKILQKLTKEALISSTKGRHGGFFLTPENMEHTLLDIIICSEGKNIFDMCILGLDKCSNENPCQLHHFFVSFKDQINTMIKDTRIENIIFALK